MTCRSIARNQAAARLFAAALAAVCLLWPIPAAGAAGRGPSSPAGESAIPSISPGGPADIVVRPEFSRRSRTNHGYVEYGFVIRNLSARHPHRVRLTLPDTYYGGYGLRVSRSAVVEPGGTVALSLFQLPVGVRGHGVQVLVDGDAGESVEAALADHDPSYGSYSRDDRYNVLISRSARAPVSDLEAAKEISVTVAPQGDAAWSPHWLAYSRYDGVIVTPADLARMAGPVRSALERYVECGGTVLVVGPYEPVSGFCGMEGTGGAPVRRTGFGTCLTAASWSEGDVASRFTNSLRATYGAVAEPVSVVQAHKVLPVVANLSIPVRGMLLLMLGFVVLIGPVNLILLRRFRRRLLLFVTTPAVSLLTCSALFGYALFSEGVHARYRLATLTVLDEGQTRATSLGWLGYYSPLASRQALRFSYQTELTPQCGGSGPTGGSGGLGVDWTEGQDLTGGWIRARTPLHFQVRKSERRRERLKLRRGPDGLAVVNGLGAPVERLTLVDFNGEVFAAADVAPGAEAGLAARPGKPQGWDLRRIYAKNWILAVQTLADRPLTHLKPGTYVAVLDGNPFVEHGLADARPHECLTVVYGYLERGDDAGPR